ncbi:MAG: isoprenylcysteine carboxylmethyltransferase family protein [Candidatus Brocadiaceae bacterium]|jgi:uncharacterized membrane protein
MKLGLRDFWYDLRNRRYRFRQFAGALFAVLLLLWALPRKWDFWVGIPFIGLGEGVRLLAAGYLRKDSSLATGGPYAFVRHPQYLGNILLAVGLCIASGYPWAVGAWVLLFWLFYLPAIRREDKRMEHKFGPHWREWRSRTPAVLPLKWPLRGSPGRFGGWSLRRAILNGEPFWMLCVLAGVASLYVRLV